MLVWASLSVTVWYRQQVLQRHKYPSAREVAAQRFGWANQLPAGVEW